MPSSKPGEIKVGSYTNIMSADILIPKDELTQINLDTKDGDDPLIVEIVFTETEEKEKKSSLKLKGEGKKGTLFFENWSSPLGTSIQSPQQFATSNDGAKIFFLAYVMKSGDIYNLKIQFMKKWEG